MNRIKEYINADVYRFFGSALTIKQKLFILPELKFIILFRKASMHKNKLLKLFYKFKLRRISMKTQIQIPPSVKIGKGFYIGHYGRIVINPGVVIGKNGTSQQVLQ